MMVRMTNDNFVSNYFMDRVRKAFLTLDGTVIIINLYIFKKSNASVAYASHIRFRIAKNS